jgi:hypothetical protein
VGVVHPEMISIRGEHGQNRRALLSGSGYL